MASVWEIKTVIISGLEQGGGPWLSPRLARVLATRIESNLSFTKYLFTYNGLAPRGKAKASRWVVSQTLTTNPFASLSC